MPVHKTKSGKWKFGNSGKEYDTKQEAEKQAFAIVYQQANKQGKKRPSKETIMSEVFGKTASGALQKRADLFGGGELNAEQKREAKAIAYRALYETPYYEGKNRPNIETDQLGERLEKELAPDLIQQTGIPLYNVPAIRDIYSELAYMGDPGTFGPVTGSRAELYQHKTPAAKKALSLLSKLKAEIAASNDPFAWETIKLRGPSYLAFALAGAGIGRLIAGRKKRWWGYGLGAAVGLGANFLRRKHYFGEYINA